MDLSSFVLFVLSTTWGRWETFNNTTYTSRHEADHRYLATVWGKIILSHKQTRQVTSKACAYDKALVKIYIRNWLDLDKWFLSSKSSNLLTMVQKSIKLEIVYQKL